MDFSSVKEEHLVIGIFSIVLSAIVFFFGNFSGEDQTEQPTTFEPLVDRCAVPVTAKCKVQVERDFSDCKNIKRIEGAVMGLVWYNKRQSIGRA